MKIVEISLFSPHFRRVNKIKPCVTVVRVNSSFSSRLVSFCIHPLSEMATGFSPVNSANFLPTFSPGSEIHRLQLRPNLALLYLSLQPRVPSLHDLVPAETSLPYWEIIRLCGPFTLYRVQFVSRNLWWFAEGRLGKECQSLRSMARNFLEESRI